MQTKTKTVPLYPPKCSHCGGSLVRDDGERKCLSCGRVWKSHLELHRFYTDHRDEILKDIADLGRPATLTKWQIPHGSINRLVSSWLGTYEKPVVAPAPQSGNHHLPELPAFSDKWAPEVMTKWLEVYQVLATNTKREEVNNGQEHTAQ